MPFDFDFNDLTPAQESFTYRGKNYWVVEASADAGRQYKNAQIQVAKFNKEGKFAGAGQLADSEPLLVSQCVYRAGPDGKLPLKKVGEEEIPDPAFRVPHQVVLTWQNRVLEQLYTWIKENSDLGGEDTEEAILKRINEDTDKLEKLRESKAESLQKNVQRSMPNGSGMDKSTDGNSATASAGEDPSPTDNS